jgi:ribosomal protein S24E
MVVQKKEGQTGVQISEWDLSLYGDKSQLERLNIEPKYIINNIYFIGKLEII